MTADYYDAPVRPHIERLRNLLKREPGIFSRQEEADLRQLLDDHADDFVWEEWAVQLHYPGGLATVGCDSEGDARDQHRRLLAEPVQRSSRIEVVRRVNVQGTYRAVEVPAEDRG